MHETESGSERTTHRWPAVVLPAVVVLGALWSVLPLPIWLAGAPPTDFKDIWTLWAIGGVITVGGTLVLAIVSRGRVNEWLVGVWHRSVGHWPTGRFLFVTGLAFAGLITVFTVFVSHGNPRYVDGFAQMFQARIFSAGRLWVEPPSLTSHFATLHMIVGPDKWFSQFPPGQPLLLALGLLTDVWWIFNPLLGLLLVLGTYRVACWVSGRTVARVSVLFLCLSTFIVAVAGTAMNHLAAATLGIGAAACVTALTTRHHRIFAITAGLLLGFMTAFRPLDAVAAALPVAAITMFDSKKPITHFGLIFIGGVLGTIPTLWFNAQTTGHWWEFGYTYLWGSNHSLGFHDVPFGIPLTPLRAVGIVGMDLHLVNRYLFDLPIPLMVLVGAAFVASRKRLCPRDVAPIVGVTGLVGCLFFYWHRDVLYGPRFLYSAVPWMVIIVARSTQLLRRETFAMDARVGKGFGVTVVVVAFVFGLVMLTPSRIFAYRDSTPSFNLHPDRDAVEAGIHNAVVVIPDGWGSRLIARMWGRGVSMAQSTRLYASIDACTLHHVLGESSPGDGRVLARLDSLAALGRPGVAFGLTDDDNLRLPEDGVITRDCADEIDFDRSGFLAFAPYLYLNNATLDGDIVWARDLRDDNDALTARYPGRDFYRYVVESGVPRFEGLDRTTDQNP